MVTSAVAAEAVKVAPAHFSAAFRSQLFQLLAPWCDDSSSEVWRHDQERTAALAKVRLILEVDLHDVFDEETMSGRGKQDRAVVCAVGARDGGPWWPLQLSGGGGAFRHPDGGFRRTTRAGPSEHVRQPPWWSCVEGA